MEALNDYFAFMMLLCLAVGLVGAILHDAARDVSLLAIGFISLSALASPIVSLASRLDAIPLPEDSASLPSGGLSDAVEESYKDGIESFISSGWSVSREDVEVRIDGFSAVDARVGELSVALTGRAALIDTRSLRDRLTREFLLPEGKCRVVIGLE